MNELKIKNLKRESGKTTELLDIAITEARQGNTVAFFVMNANELKRIHNLLKDKYFKSDYDTYNKLTQHFKLITFDNADITKGTKLKAIFVDECFLMNPIQQNKLIQYSLEMCIPLVGYGTRMRKFLTFEMFEEPTEYKMVDGMPMCKHGVPYDSICEICNLK